MPARSAHMTHRAACGTFRNTISAPSRRIPRHSGFAQQVFVLTIVSHHFLEDDPDVRACLRSRDIAARFFLLASRCFHPTSNAPSNLLSRAAAAQRKRSLLSTRSDVSPTEGCPRTSVPPHRRPDPFQRCCARAASSRHLLEVLEDRGRSSVTDTGARGLLKRRLRRLRSLSFGYLLVHTGELAEGRIARPAFCVGTGKVKTVGGAAVLPFGRA